MKIDFKNFSEKIKTIDWPKKIGSFAVQKEASILVAVFIIFLGYLGYVWYLYAHNYQWTDARRQEYVNTKNSGISFNKGKFENVLHDINARRDEYQKNVDNPRDIFRLK